MVKIRTRRAPSADRQTGEPAPGAASETATSAAEATNDGHSLGSETGGDAPASTEAPADLPPLGEEAAAELSLGFDDRTADDDEEEPPPARRRGRKPGPKPKGKRSHHKKTVREIFEEPPAQKLDRKMAGLFLGVIEGIAVPQLGERARFEPDERRLIEPPLANLIERLTPESARMFSQFADPIMLGVGFLIWGARVFGTPNRPPAAPPRPTLLRREPVSEPTAAPGPAAAPVNEGPSETVADIATEWSM